MESVKEGDIFLSCFIFSQIANHKDLSSLVHKKGEKKNCQMNKQKASSNIAQRAAGQQAKQARQCAEQQQQASRPSKLKQQAT